MAGHEFPMAATSRRLARAINSIYYTLAVLPECARGYVKPTWAIHLQRIVITNK